MPDKPEKYIVEYVVMGNSVKVTAFDPVSLTEAIIIGPQSASRKQLAQLAIRKLHYIANKPKSD